MNKPESTITIETANGQVPLDSPEGRARIQESIALSHALPIKGKLLKTLIGRVCEKKPKDCPEMPMHSVGIGKNGIAATDTRQAVIVGEIEDSYDATSQRSARLEAERASIYEDAIHPGNIERLTKEEGGEIRTIPPVGKVIAKIDDMKVVALLNPELLKSAAEIAVAAGASKMEILTGSDPGMIGFRFSYWPDEQLSLFSEFKSVPVSGVIAKMIERDEEGENSKKEQPPTQEATPDLYEQACAYCAEKGNATTSMLQRKFAIGFMAATALIERMEESNLVGPHDGPRPRKWIGEAEAN